MSYYTCGIIEDEELALSLLEKYIKRMGGVKIKWSAPSVADVLSAPHEKVDFVFLDLINNPLPIYTTIDHTINQYGKIIITTAYDAGYVESLDIDFIRLLNKPFSYNAFQQVMKDVLTELKY